MSDSYINDLKIATDEQLAKELFTRLIPKIDIHFIGSHMRWLRAMKEYKSPSVEEVKGVIQGFQFKGPPNMIVVRDILASSCCPHHFYPVMLKADFAYIPSDMPNTSYNSIGLSKIPRFIKMLAKQFITQEELNNQIVEAFMQSFEHLTSRPSGVICVLRGIHTCLACRGVESRTSDVVTSAMSGAAFEQSATRAEFFSLLRN